MSDIPQCCFGKGAHTNAEWAKVPRCENPAKWGVEGGLVWCDSHKHFNDQRLPKVNSESVFPLCPCRKCRGGPFIKRGVKGYQAICGCGSTAPWKNSPTKAILAWNEENPREGK